MSAPLPIVAKLGDIECVSYVARLKRLIRNRRITTVDTSALRSSPACRLLPISDDWLKEPTNV